MLKNVLQGYLLVIRCFFNHRFTNINVIIILIQWISLGVILVQVWYQWGLSSVKRYCFPFSGFELLLDLWQTHAHEILVHCTVVFDLDCAQPLFISFALFFERLLFFAKQGVCYIIQIAGLWTNQAAKFDFASRSLRRIQRLLASVRNAFSFRRVTIFVWFGDRWLVLEIFSNLDSVYLFAYDLISVAIVHFDL